MPEYVKLATIQDIPEGETWAGVPARRLDGTR